MSALADKVAIVTGASSGIGEAAALALGKAGCRVVLAARRADRLKNLEERIIKEGGHAISVTCDVADREQVRAMVDETMSDFGRVDILINNAGVMPLAHLKKVRFDDWDRMIDVNLRGALSCIGLCLPIMLKQKSGHIVNVSSVAGRLVFPMGAVYCGTKHALHAISEGLRAELAQNDPPMTDIRVTIIAPGVVRTELPDSITDDETREAAKSMFGSMANALESEDIAQAILYALKAPKHVNVNELLIRPTSQPR